jgi:GR25 family glycosyltransferase involved in LPS biosynthesis
MSLLNDCYISYLNLDSRADRLQHMQNELTILIKNGTPEMINAVRTRGKLPEEIDNGTNPKYQVMWKRTKGALPCHYGQVEIMQTALENEKHAFVLEDDVHFCEDFKERIEYIETALWGKYWDIIWLGGTTHIPAYWHTGNNPDLLDTTHRGDTEPTDDERIVRTYGAFCTYAYIVNKNSIEKVLNMLESVVHLSMGIDWAMIKIQPQLNTFMFFPGCCRQIDNRSDIGQGDTIFSGFAALNGRFDNSRYWFQERMEDFSPTEIQW